MKRRRVGVRIKPSVGQEYYLVKHGFTPATVPASKTCWIQPDTQTAFVIFTNGDHGPSTYSRVFRKLIGDAASLSWI